MSKEITEMLREFSAQLIDNFEWRAPIILQAAKQIEQLEQEVEVLRQYGNKDCTAMADERLAELKDQN